MGVEALRAEGLGARFGARTIFAAVGLRVAAGEVCGLLGPNGAGKTTLFRLLAGLGRGSGRVWLMGQEVSRWPIHRRVRAGLGYLPQEPSVFSGMSVRANILAVLEVHGLPSDGAEALLAHFGLTALADAMARTLSGGERRRLELARLMAAKPRVVLMDEPFAALDPGAVADLATGISELAAAGVGVLLSDHRVETALTICHRACILDAGRMICERPAAELMRELAASPSLFGSPMLEPRST